MIEYLWLIAITVWIYFHYVDIQVLKKQVKEVKKN